MRSLSLSLSIGSVALVVGLVAGCDDDTTKGDMAKMPDLTVAQPDQCCTQTGMEVPTIDMAKFDMPMMDIAMVDGMPIDAPMDASVDATPSDLKGIDASVPPADFSGPDMTTFDAGPPPTVIGHSRWVDFCQAFAACGFWGGSVSSCIGAEPRLGNLAFAPPSVITCIHDAGTSCSLIKQCLNNGDPNTACDSSYKSACSNALTYTACFGTFKYTVDCSKLGLVCTAPTAPISVPNWCGFGKCDPAAQLDYCVSDFQAQCLNGSLSPTEDCRVFTNEKCALNSMGESRCTGTGPACTADRCVGDTLVACKEKHEAQYDCTKRGLHCIMPLVGGVPTPQCGLGVACDGTFVEKCVGSTLTYCDSGTVSTINCTTAGWAKCVPNDSAGGGGFCSP